MPSVAKSRRLPEPYVYFVDRSLGGRAVVQALRDGALLPGEQLHAHDEHFVQDARDVEWLTEVGARGWVVLTKDTRIKTNHVELEALLQARVALFSLGRGDLSGVRMCEIFCRAMSPIRTALRRHAVPLVATVSGEAVVSVHIADGVEVRPPTQHRPPRTKQRSG